MTWEWVVFIGFIISAVTALVVHFTNETHAGIRAENTALLVNLDSILGKIKDLKVDDWEWMKGEILKVQETQKEIAKQAEETQRVLSQVNMAKGFLPRGFSK